MNQTLKRMKKSNSFLYLTPHQIFDIESKKEKGGIEGYRCPKKYFDYHEVLWLRKRENIYYDGENKKIYCGIYGSIKSLKELENSFIIEGNFGNISTFGGFEEINIEKENEISDLIVFKYE